MVKHHIINQGGKFSSVSESNSIYLNRIVPTYNTSELGPKSSCVNCLANLCFILHIWLVKSVFLYIVEIDSSPRSSLNFKISLAHSVKSFLSNNLKKKFESDSRFLSSQKFCALAVEFLTLQSFDNP